MKRENSFNRIDRRSFLKISAIWAGGAWIVGVPSLYANPYRELTDSEAEIMDALADTIIPPGEYAGGKDARVTRFIDQQIGRYGYLQHDKEMYKTCLPALNNNSRERFGARFTELKVDQKEEYLKAIEAGEYNNQPENSDWGQFTPSSFFNTTRNQCMMGFYGSPIHGGNKDYVSYRMLGLY